MAELNKTQQYNCKVMRNVKIDDVEYNAIAYDYCGRLWAIRPWSGDWKCLIPFCPKADNFGHGPTHHWDVCHATYSEFKYSCPKCNRKFRYKNTGDYHLKNCK